MRPNDTRRSGGAAGGRALLLVTMIARDHAPLWRLWPWALRRLGLLLVLDITIAVLHTIVGVTAVSMPSLPLAIMGGSLSIFLAFRNSSAYDRWWEARTLWGALVNNARTFSRQVLTLVDAEHPEVAKDELRRELIELQIDYVHALRCHLRGQTPFPELSAKAPSDLVAWLRGQKNVPFAILQRLGERTRELYDLGRLDTIRLAAIDGTLTELCNVQGACERIKNTPLPRQYEYFPRALVVAYCLLLPLGMVGGMGLWTPLASTLVSAIFVCLEVIGRDIEDPFENTVNDTPMSNLTRAIEINLRQGLRVGDVPNEVRPVDGFVF
jgi:putative membrane protein